MWLNQPSESLQKEKDSQKLMPRACRNRGMWGPGDLKGPFLSIVTPIEEKNANYSQITYACQDFWFIKSFIQFLLAK